MTSYGDEIKTFTVTSWDKKEKMLQVEITKFRKMEEVLTVLFTFSGQNAEQTLTKVKPVGHIFAKKIPQNKICFQYEWKKNLKRI